MGLTLDSGSMHAVILASRQGWHTRELTRALEARGHPWAIVPYEGLTASVGARPGLRSGTTELDRADAVFARIIPSGSLEQIIFRVDALHRLEERGVRVMNSPRAIERTVDKFWTSCLLEQCGIPTPDTVVCESPEEAMAAFRHLGDVIVKPLFGSMGLGMVRVADEEMAYRVFRTVETIRGVYYIQRTIDHEGRDYRVFVVGGRVLAAIERRADGWRTNVSRGGEATATRLPDPWAALAIRAAAAVGAEYAGVDLLPARDGTVYVLEVNGIPGWRGLQEATGIDVAGALVDHLLRPGP
jgi:RimK family alpha-L-glutamate ligase